MTACTGCLYQCKFPGQRDDLSGLRNHGQPQARADLALVHAAVAFEPGIERG